MDQTIIAARDTVNPVVRGYRRYYGESRVIETDMSDAFGFEETKDMNGKETYKYYVEKLGLNPDEARERTKQQGKDPYGKRAQNAPKKIRNQKGFIDRMTLSEVEKVVEDLVLKSKKDSGLDFLKKVETEVPLFKIITLHKNHRHPIVPQILDVYKRYQE
jgi:hypothetical protein